MGRLKRGLPRIGLTIGADFPDNEKEYRAAAIKQRAAACAEFTFREGRKIQPDQVEYKPIDSCASCLRMAPSWRLREQVGLTGPATSGAAGTDRPATRCDGALEGLKAYGGDGLSFPVADDGS